MAGKANYLPKTDCWGFFFLNHCFISTSLSVSPILYFSVWQVNQEAVAKSSIVRGTIATLRCTARHELFSDPGHFLPRWWYPRVLQLPVTMNASFGFVLRMSQ